jgi:diguanylate cyclase (GGDEF)-like protein
MPPRRPREVAFARRCVWLSSMLWLLLCASSPALDLALDREQGMPLIRTFLPSQFNTPATPVGAQAFALVSLRDGSLVVANNGGLLRLQGAGTRTWNPLHGNVLSLARADDGRVYAGGIGDIGYFDEFGSGFVSLAPWASKLGVTFGDFWVTVVSADGNAYFADLRHVFRWDGSALHLVYTAQPELLLGAHFARGVVVLDPGAGLVAIDTEGVKLLAGSERLKSAGNCALAAVGEGAVSICSDGSALRWHLDGSHVELPSDAATRALLDTGGVAAAAALPDGDLLVGTRRAGVLLLDSDAVLKGRIAGVAEWGDSRVFSLLPRAGDGIWVGLDYGLSHVEWPGQVSRFDALLGLPRAMLASERIDGRLLAATTRGIYALDAPAVGEAFARFRPWALTRTTLFSMKRVDRALLVGSRDGVYRVVDGNAEQLDPRLAYIAQPLDTTGDNLLAGGLHGAWLLRRVDGRWNASDVPGVDTEIRDIVADDDGALWLAGNYPGAFRVRLAEDFGSAPQLKRFGIAQGLPAGRIVPLRLPRGVVFDSPEGLLRFDAATQRFLPDTALRILLPASAGETRVAAQIDADRALVAQHDRLRQIRAMPDGSWREELTPLARLPRGMLFRDIAIESDGTVWVSTNEALFRHRPATQGALPPLPQPRILIEGDNGEFATQVAQADGVVGIAPRALRFRFEQAFFVGMEELRFRSRLAPLEKEWSRWQETPERDFTHLPDGRYTLQLQVRDIFGRDSETAELAFALAPPWWLRWWTIAFGVVLLVGALVWAVRRRERRLRQRTDELARLVHERTQELEQASITDALTGLRNRRYFDRIGPSLSRDAMGHLLVALVDVDHFKRINDTRGHAAGDEVLRAVALRLRGSVPEEAVAIRWGGEEFLLLVPLSGPDAAPAVVRRLLHAVGDAPFRLSEGPPLAVTCSIGWECLAAPVRSPLDVALHEVDRHLYAAKRGGRDRAQGPETLAAEPREPV